ncbi:MAG TPA: tRNA (adenosine(37)-N6)-threonylcarbamoyltransferase complex dimerization subunit type 1 TsaB [Candidatus Saccharimonadales bacterium]|jgi:tRNA threonylcarbamoyladenosine biosynthesis protein TsaB|nr:tRNA (adenosine(37)-N6)-threonylcarbamoyltransferase complex dimerization subunit type 1 TsaB [Candidatus Saccharimonadales bacterium]
MLILTLRTDKPEAEVGLFDDKTQIAYETWAAHRELSVQLHRKIEAILHSQGKALTDIGGIVCFAGPGSFTGLRIGLTVGDVLAYGLTQPVVGAKDPDWIQNGIDRLLRGENDKIAMPEYGAPVHITVSKK